MDEYVKTVLERKEATIPKSKQEDKPTDTSSTTISIKADSLNSLKIIKTEMFHPKLVGRNLILESETNMLTDISGKQIVIPLDELKQVLATLFTG